MTHRNALQTSTRPPLRARGRNRGRNRVWLLAFVAALLSLATAAGADPYVLYGQVFQIAPEAAADETLDASALPLGPTMPYVRVKVVHPDTGDELGTPVYAGATGNFTAPFNAPAGATVEVRVYRVIEGEAERIPDARENINQLTLASPATGMAVKVASAEQLSFAPASPAYGTSIGIVFTQIGLVEIPYISQDLTRPDKGRIGLADLSGDLVRADEQNLPDNPITSAWNAVFKDAPFGGRLHLFGGFGQTSGVVPCIGDIDWYRVKIRPVSFDGAGNPVYGASTYGTDLLRKTRFEIDYVPTFSADAYLETIGPYAGEDLTTGSAVAVSNLYRAAVFSSTSPSTVIYSNADMRYSWVTGSLSGLYEVSLEYYRHVGGTDTDPDVVRIPDSCFSGTLPPADAAKVALHKLLVRIDNTPLTSGFDGLYIKTGATRSINYLAPGNRCDILELGPGSTIEIDYKARHNGGYLRSYSLSATSNAGSTVLFAGDDYGSHVAAGPLWEGQGTAALPVVTAANLTPFPEKCAYIFDLTVRGRIQNGYSYLQHHHHRTAFYLDP